MKAIEREASNLANFHTLLVAATQWQHIFTSQRNACRKKTMEKTLLGIHCCNNETWWVQRKKDKSKQCRFCILLSCLWSHSITSSIHQSFFWLLNYFKSWFFYRWTINGSDYKKCSQSQCCKKLSGLYNKMMTQ